MNVPTPLDFEPLRAPQGVYACKDGARIAISVGNDREWTGLCEAMGQPELADRPEYAGNLVRQARNNEIDALIAAWCAESEAAALEIALQACNVPAVEVGPLGASAP